MENTTSELNVADPRSVAQHLIIQSEPQEEAPQEEPSDEFVEEVEAEAETDIEDEEYAEEEATLPDGPEEALFKVKVDGEERLVPEEELKRGYSGQKYIQQKMREVAEARKQVDAQMARAQQMEAQYAEAIKAYAERLQTTDPTPPPRSMRETDPIGYLEAMEDYRQEVDARQRLHQEQQLLAQREAQTQAQQRAEYVKAQTQVVLEQIPELRDAETAPKAIEAMMAEGRRRGFTDAELKGESDPRFVMALHELAKMRAQGNLGTNREVKRGAIKPGAKKSIVSTSKKRADAARQKSRTTGKTEDIAAFLLTKG